MPRINGRIEVDADRCKACGLCAHFCPKQCFEPGQALNASGYTPIRFLEMSECSACGICAVVCPDMALKVYNLRNAVEPQEILH